MDKQVSTLMDAVNHKLTSVGEKLQAQYTAKATTILTAAIADLKAFKLSNDEIAAALKTCVKSLRDGGYLQPEWLVNHLLREAGIRQRSQRKDKNKKKKSTTKGGATVSGKSTNGDTPKGGDAVNKIAGTAASALQAVLLSLPKLSAKELDIVFAQLEKLRAREQANFDQRTKGAVLKA